MGAFVDSVPVTTGLLPDEGKATVCTELTVNWKAVRRAAIVAPALID